MSGFEGKVRHGTASGFRAHQNLGERPCDPCHQAKSAYDKRRYAAPEITRQKRDSARAQARALGRLKDIYPDIYRVLYLEEKAKITSDGES